MTEFGAPRNEDITLCLVITSRYGNLANVLSSVNHLVGDIVVIDASNGGDKIRHLASEYDAHYETLPADPDESALLNLAFSKVKSAWALFMHQEEVFHGDDLDAIFAQIRTTDHIAFDLPIIPFEEPTNHHFETRLIRTASKAEWRHSIFPSITASVSELNKNTELENEVNLLSGAAIVTLGEPDWEEWELKDALSRIENEVERDPKNVLFWFYLAKRAAKLEEWDRSHAAVEEGLSVISQIADIAIHEPLAVNGLIGMFCETMIKSQYYPEKTVDSLLTIFSNMPGDGRLAVPLGRLLTAIHRSEDAKRVQRMAIDNFFIRRSYNLSFEEGLFNPIMFEWELTWQEPGDVLLNSVIEIQTLLAKHHYKLQLILQHVFKHHQKLFFEIQTILQRSLKNTD